MAYLENSRDQIILLSGNVQDSKKNQYIVRLNTSIITLINQVYITTCRKNVTFNLQYDNNFHLKETCFWRLSFNLYIKQWKLNPVLTLMVLALKVFTSQKDLLYIVPANLSVRLLNITLLFLTKRMDKKVPKHFYCFQATEFY